MSLSAKYQAFLASPSQAALAPHASLHYVTTLTSINEPAAIFKHFSVQEKLLKKKEQKVLSKVEGAQEICLDVETTIEFVAGGGAYLPGLDDNFVADRTVVFPMIHIVHFDSEHKISQIRLYWDQGSLLKQIDVIGARARNWPIRDGADQSRLIANSVGLVSQAPSTAASSRRSTAQSRGGADEVVITERPGTASSNGRMSRNPTRGDPHTSLNLFEERDVNVDNTGFSKPPVPRAQSAKPPPRNLNELFVGDESSPAPDNTYDSPLKSQARTGGGKNFKPNRLFVEGGEEDIPVPMSVKTNSKKYDHFEFADGDDETATPKANEGRPTTSSKNSKHQSQWDFEDFVTPAKVAPKIQAQNVRHFGWSDDEAETSPIKRPIVHKPRRDQNTNFEFVDDGTPVGDKKPAPNKGKLHNKGLGLYKDHVLHTTSDDEDSETARTGDNKGPLSHTTNNKNRKKDFGAQWEMTDSSPNPNTQSKDSSSSSGAINGKENNKGKPNDTQKKVLKSLDAHWHLYDESPEPVKGKGINIAGNGMGGRKGTESHWSMGYEGEEGSVEKEERRKEERSGTKRMAGAGGKSDFWDF